MATRSPSPLAEPAAPRPAAGPSRSLFASYRTLVRRSTAVGLTLIAMTAAAQSPEPTQRRTGKAVVALTIRGDQAVQNDLRQIVAAESKLQKAGGTAVTLLQRARTQRDLVVKALRAEGYYGSHVAARVAGQDIDAVAALDAIDALPAGADVPVEIAVDTGPRFIVRRIDIELSGAPADAVARDKLPLAVGQPAVAAKILATDEDILGQLQRRGYALARIAKRDVLIDHDTQAALITWRVESGPPAGMGPVTFRGLQRTDADFLARRVPYKLGDPYHPDRLDALRTRLTDLGIFSSVRIVRADALDAEGRLPVEVDVVERLPRTIGFAASYATSEGVGVRAYWQHRNLTGEADSLRLSAEATGLVDHKLIDTGFAITAAYRKPDFLRVDQALTTQGAILREISDAYRRRSASVGMGLERTIDKGFVVRAGVAVESEIVQTAERRDTYLPISVPLGLTLDRSNDVLDPSRGFRLALDVIPYFELGNTGKPFLKLRATGSTYFDLSGGGTTVVALRGSVGVMPGATKDAVPPDKRFFAGGGGSVRGFDYQSAGPRDIDHRPLGGQSIVEGSVELRQRLTETIGAVAFVDAGTAYAGPFPGKGDGPRLGAGIGVRYYSDFGPIRADIGVPLNRRPGDSRFGLYVSIGQAF